GERTGIGDFRRLHRQAAPRRVEFYSFEFLRRRSQWHTAKRRVQQGIGAMYRVPIGLIGRRRTGTEHELTPSFARTSALSCGCAPVPHSPNALGALSAPSTSPTA